MADPHFSLVGTNPFGFTDVGSTAAPAFADLDGDGDLDALVGANTSNTARYYINTGTSAAPTFSLQAGTNPFGFSSVGNNANPSFGDLDGDGDLDVVIGGSDGRTHFFRNTGTTAAATFSLQDASPFNDRLGSSATPELIDLDGDGDLDLLIGEAANLYFYWNTGTSASWTFSSAGTNPFGLTPVSVANPTMVDIDGDGDLDALIGNTGGNIVLFRNTGTSTAPTFSLEATDPFGFSDAGAKAAPVFLDVDGDGDLDALVGNNDGNTLLFLNVPVTGPSAPSAPDLAAASDSGSSSTDNLTNVTTPTVTGAATAGDTVVLYDGATASGTATADGSGLWTITAGTLSGGAHTLTARAIDGTGTSSASSALVVTVDTTAPVLSSAAVNATTLTLTYDGALTSATPTTGDYTVTAGGSAVTVSGVAVSGGAVTLTLASAVTWGQTVTVGYSVPGSNPVADDAGNSAAALSSRSVTNNTPSVPTFTLVGTNPFGFSDVGSRSFPVLADIDGDGDLDALVGERSTGNVLFFLNTGTSTAPTFSLDSNTNPFNFDHLSSTSHPALADLDGDGDLDALIGSNIGTTDFYRNIGTTASPTFSREATAPFGSVDLGTGTAPKLADLDGDGDLDLLVGTFDSVIFYRNTGTSAAWTFSLEATSPFGLTAPGNWNNPSLIDIDLDGDLDALVGVVGGETVFFRNTGTTASPTFSLEATNPFGLTTLSSLASPTFADIDGDGDADAMVGDGNGDIVYFRNGPEAVTLTPVTPSVPDLAAASDSGASSSDDITKTTAPSFTGAATAGISVVLYDGATAVGTTTASGGLWTIAASTLADGAHSLTAREVTSTATSTASSPLVVTIDTTAPVLSSAAVNGATLTLTYDGALDAASDPSTTAYTVTAGGGTVAVTAADANGGAVTLTLAGAVSAGQIVTVDYTAGGSTVQDAAGNVAAALSSQSVTNNTASPVVDNGGGTTTTTEPAVPSSPGTTTIDGLTVITTQSTNTDGTTTLTTNIPVVAVDRAEQLGASGLADIPLVLSGGVTQLQTQLPVGVGMQVETISGSGAMGASQALDSLILAIEARTGGSGQAGDRSEMTGIGRTFLGTLPTDGSLFVRTVVPTSTTGSSLAQPIVISSAVAGGSQQEALVIDTRGLPSGSVIKLDNVEFAAIIGSVTVTGGDGSQRVTGDSGNQIIVLGADDDILYAGAGDDLVGSRTGDDMIYGEAGRDRLFGGLGNDLLDGGNGVDAVRITGTATQTTVTAGSHAAATVSGLEGIDTLQGVEILRFDDGVRLTNTSATVMTNFVEDLYLARNPDVVAAVKAGTFASGAEHYAKYGAAEGRGDLFTVDEAFYRAQNPDVDAAIISGKLQSATQHFQLYGLQEGRAASALFDVEWYLAQNPDVAAAVARGETTAQAHYANFGWHENRDPSVWFDTSEYEARYADVAAAGVNPLTHFLNFGQREGRLAPAADIGLWI